MYGTRSVPAGRRRYPHDWSGDVPVIGLPSGSVLSATVVALIGCTCPTAALASSDPSVDCSITTTPLIFGEYSPYQGRATDLTSSITVTCTTSSSTAQPFNGTITLSGKSPSHNRQLLQGFYSLDYQLYLDPARTRLWGDGISQSESLSLSGTVSPTIPFHHTILIYGRIPGMQLSASVAHYFDYITATLDY